MFYYIWTVGCQMNEADSERLARALEDRGLQRTASVERADLIVLNTCSVRQAAEEKAFSKAGTLRPLKLARPDLLVALGGCMVAEDTTPDLRRRLPYVDLFFQPADFTELLAVVDDRLARGAGSYGPASDGCLAPTVQEPPVELTSLADPFSPTRWLPVMNGCNRRCTYCIVPFRRGAERSRPLDELVAETGRLVRQGAREVTLLGQIVDRYGRDLPGRPDLSDLLRALSEIDGLDRIRFLTSHPRDFTDRIIDAMAELPKVCEHVNIPVQAGDDAVLKSMARGYTVDHYRQVIARIRERVPGVSLATDVIVGFSGETEAQFQRTLDLLAEVRFDVVRVAMYSVRPGTHAGDHMPDDVPQAEKKSRLLRVEALHERIAGELNAALLGQTVEVLVEGRDEEKGRWKGRTRTNKLVFFADERNFLGRMVQVRIERTGPWSLQGALVGGEAPLPSSRGKVLLPIV